MADADPNDKDYFSESDEDHEDYSDDDQDDDYDNDQVSCDEGAVSSYDDSSPSLLSEMKDNWQQHFLAVLVAIMATWFAHGHIDKSISATQQPNAATVDTSLLQKHDILVDYQRTANLSFCGNIARRTMQRNGLHVLDFELDKERAASLAQHYAADLWQDDRYKRVIGEDDGADENSNMVAISDALGDHKEYGCIEKQVEQSSKIKGLSYFYSSPPIQTMYVDQSPTSSSSGTKQKVSEVYLTFRGFGIKFINLSTKPVMLYWEGKQRRLIGEIGPFESIGTAATTSGQTFSVTPIDDPEHRLEQWVVTIDTQVIYFDPPGEPLSGADEARYKMHMLNKQYAHEYEKMAKRAWLAHFPRPLPVHHMWPASHFGQTHSFQSEGKKYEMTVASVTPRVFTIANFLTNAECNELIQLAKEEGLQPSTLQSGSTRARQQLDQSTRSSSNTWVPRSSTELADRIYRRAAHLLQIDESLLQKQPNEILHEHHHSIAESLQVVRYKKKEEYTAHHDFVYPPTFHRHQPTRFATVLLYLNQNFEGGETVFPRAVNSRNHEGVSIEPRKGTAVLFYNMLPDGNHDDLSQHSSTPIVKGEKWLANLWVWEPHIF